MINLADKMHWRSQAIRAQQLAWLEPLLLACALTVWFGYELGTRPLWSPDEGRYAEIPREMAASGDYITPRLNGVKYFEKPPLVYWLAAGSIKLFGVTEWAVRLWPALFALLGCMAMYFLGRRLYGTRTGFLAAIVLATNPLYDLMGGALTLDMPVSAWLTIALMAFLLGVRESPGIRRRLWLYLCYVSMALAVLTKGLIGIFIPALVIGAWIALLGEWRLLREIHLHTGLIIMLAITAPWHILVAQANPEFARFYFIHEHFERYLTTVHHRYQPAWFFAPVLVAGFYPWSALLPQALRDVFPFAWRRLWCVRRQHRDTWFVLLWAAIPFVFFSLSSSKLIPYLLPVLPPLALMVGRSVASRWERKEGPAPVARWSISMLAGWFATIWIALPWFRSESWSVMAAVAQLDGAFYVPAAMWLLVGAAPWAAVRRRDGRPAWVALSAASALLVLTFDCALARLDLGRSVKNLALAIKPELGPNDEVIAYREYYQDLPVYLQRRITVADWKGELEFGATLENTREWMIDTAVFRQRWVESRTIYLFTHRSHYDALRAAPPGAMCIVTSDARVVVVVNRECRS